jgi:hypothetical protein
MGQHKKTQRRITDGNKTANHVTSIYRFTSAHFSSYSSFNSANVSDIMELTLKAY